MEIVLSHRSRYDPDRIKRTAFHAECMRSVVVIGGGILIEFIRSNSVASRVAIRIRLFDYPWKHPWTDFSCKYGTATE